MVESQFIQENHTRFALTSNYYLRCGIVDLAVQHMSVLLHFPEQWSFTEACILEYYY
jgi:hypothetical protein